MENSSHAHLAADAEGLEGVEAEPAAVAGLPEAVHELGVESPLQGAQPHQDDVLLLLRQLGAQHVVTPPGEDTHTHKHIHSADGHLEWLQSKATCMNNECILVTACVYICPLTLNVA